MAIVVPSLLYRALIPLGFMPVASTGGVVRLGLCPGTVDGASHIAARADQHAQQHAHPGHRSSPCVYALGGTALSTASQAVQAPVPAVQQPPLSPDMIPLFPATMIRVQLPRGPPAVV
jgi:hypothetical protein